MVELTINQRWGRFAMVTMTCKGCRQQFQVTNDRKDTAQFCSMACRGMGTKHAATCRHCGAEFERYKSGHHRMKYCSNACYLAAVRKPVVKPPAKPRYYRTCEECRQEFRVTATRKETARWCSKACQRKSSTWRQECSEREQGEKHWRWSGGVYKTQQGYIRHKRKLLTTESATFNHRIVVALMMLRDAPGHPFLVQVKGAWRLHLEIEVHHIDRIRANNDPSNLLAVTKDAHAKIHHSGRKPAAWECWPPNPLVW